MIALEYLFLWFLLYAFVGWVYESILVSISEHRWVNRGFLNGPLCPIYGCGAVLAIVLLRDLHNPVVIFFISSFGACTLEYVTSWGMEKLFHARWWDYSHYRFNIQGRICLLGAVVFGFAGVIITDVTQPVVERITRMIPLPAVHWMCAIFAVIVITDTVITVLGVIDLATILRSSAKPSKHMRKRPATRCNGVGMLSEINSVVRSKACRNPPRRRLSSCQHAGHCNFHFEQTAASYDQCVPAFALHGFHQIQQDHRNRT